MPRRVPGRRPRSRLLVAVLLLAMTVVGAAGVRHPRRRPPAAPSAGCTPTARASAPQPTSRTSSRPSAGSAWRRPTARRTASGRSASTQGSPRSRRSGSTRSGCRTRTSASTAGARRPRSTSRRTRRWSRQDAAAGHGRGRRRAPKAHGLSVILDRHRPDSGRAVRALVHRPLHREAAGSPTGRCWPSGTRNNPTVIGADLHNEPHGSACWGCGDPARDWAAAATRAGNAVLAVNPHLLIVVEGVERQSDGSTTWWGGGLADVRAPRRSRWHVAGPASSTHRTTTRRRIYAPDLVRRARLPGQPARRLGPQLGLPRSSERHRPGAARRVRHQARDHVRPAVARSAGRAT